MNKLYLLLGSNLGDRQKKILQASQLIEKKIGKIIRRSALYQTAAWGKTDEPDFLNQVIIVESKLSAEDIMQRILNMEEKLGRIRTVKNASRTIDIDILFYNKEIINKKTLVIPHPQIKNRRFVLIPLNQLSANFIHPVLKKNIHQLLNSCKDKLDVKKF